MLLGVGPLYQFLIKHRLPIGLPLSWRKEWASVLLNDLMLLIVGGACVALLGWRPLLLVQLPVVLIAGALGVWLFYVQHTFRGAYWSRKEYWDYNQAAVAGSSHYDLPRVLHWFTGSKSERIRLVRHDKSASFQRASGVPISPPLSPLSARMIP